MVRAKVRAQHLHHPAKTAGRDDRENQIAGACDFGHIGGCAYARGESGTQVRMVQVNFFDNILPAAEEQHIGVVGQQICYCRTEITGAYHACRIEG